MDEAELIIAVFDGSRALGEEEHALIDELKQRATGGQTVLPVLNKSDLGGGSVEDLAPLGEVILLSAATGEGMQALEDKIVSLFVDGTLDIRNDAVIASAQQHAAALRALTSLESAVASLQMGAPLDVCCVDIEAAMSALSALDGRAVDEDIVNEIFAHFCVGK